MRRIYLIRHGSPLIPYDQHRCIGHSDYPLSAKGEKEIEKVKDFLTDKKISKIFSSPLLRCSRSAEIISGKTIPLITVDALKEINMGDWEALSFDEIRIRFPEKYMQRGLDFGGFIPPRGESFTMCLERSQKAFLEITKQTRDNIAIVSHAGVNRVLICWLAKLNINDLFSIRQPYGCVNIIADHDGYYDVADTGLISFE